MSTSDPLLLTFDAFELDEAQARLLHHGEPVAIPPKSFDMLCVLVRQAGKLISKDDLLDATWGHQFVSESALKSTISQVRTALGDDAKQPRYIETVSRRGYRFMVPTRAAGQVAAPAPGDASIVGREAALARLHEAWQRVQQGQRQMVWVSGEAGVGKTTLIDAFVASLKVGNVLVARGQCVEPFGQDEPYMPVLEMLGALGRADARLAALARTVAPTWLAQLPWLGSEAEREALHRELAGSSQERMLREGAELLDRCSALRPLVLVTEDLHWADHSTVRLIDALARRRQGMPLLWIASFRPAELVVQQHPMNGVRHQLRLAHLSEEIALDPFSERDVGEVLARRFPQLPSGGFAEPFVRELHRRTDGLPLFVVSAIDDLAARGAFGQAGEWETGHVPESLAGVMEQRIARLDAPTREVLEAAAVCGRAFSARTVADALGLTVQAVGDACDRLVRLNDWLRYMALERQPDGSVDALYTFRHALFCDLFYRRSGAVVRTGWHRRIADSLNAARTGMPAEVALHYERGLAPLLAARHYVMAADHALRHFAPQEATRLVARGLALLPQAEAGTERIQLELALVARRSIAGALLHGLTADEVVASLERGAELGEHLPSSPELAWNLSGRGWVTFVRSDFDGTRALAARIEALGHTQSDPLLCASGSMLAGVALLYQGELQAGSAELDKALAIYATLGERLQRTPLLVDPWTATLCYSALAAQLCGREAAARELAQQAIARSEAVGAVNAREIGYRFAAIVAERQGDAEALALHARTHAELVERHGLAHGEGPSSWTRGIARVRLGHPAEGHALIMAGLARRRGQGMSTGTTQVLAYAAEAQLALGELAAAQAHVGEGLALADQLGERIFVPDLWLLQGRVLRAGGDAQGADEALQRAEALAKAQRG